LKISSKERHGDADAVGLRGADEQASPPFGLLEAVADDPLDAAAGKDALLDGYLVRRVLVDAAAGVRVLALRVLPDHGYVEAVRVRRGGS
jgi:hypothetical protein